MALSIGTAQITMKKVNGITTKGIADKRRQENGGIKQSWNPMFETTQFPDRTRGELSDDDSRSEELQTKKPATSRYVSEFHPLSYLYTVVRGNLEDDCDKDGNPRLPTAIPGVLNRKLGREFNAKINKLNREIDDIQKRIDGMHETVNALNKERCSENAKTSNRNFGNEIYLLVRNVGMWMRRMETKAQLIERIKWSIYILEALQEIDESCNATMFWLYAAWRKMQHKIGPNGANEDWDKDLGNNEPKYDKYKCDETPEIIRIFTGYEAAYRRNIEISKLIKDDLIRSGSDEKLSRFLDDNYTRCKGCRALFCRRYDDLFGTRIHCPSRIKARENLLSKGTTGEEDGSNLIVCFFCTDCFDIFNPSIIKKLKRDKELKIEKDLEVLIEEHQQEQDKNSTNKSNKKRKKKKRKKNKKNNANGSSTTLTNGEHHNNSADEQQSETEQENIDINGSYDESEKSVNGLNEKANGKDANYDDEIDMDGNSSMNDVYVDFLLKTGSIIELNAFMDKTLGIEKD